MRFDLIIGTASSGNCKAQFAYSLARLAMYFSRVAVYPEIEEQSVEFLSMEGTGVGENREKIVRKFLSTDATHLLFIDDDMGFNPDVLHTLASRRQPIVGCNYRRKVPPAEFLAYRGGEIKTTKESTGIEPVDFLGFGFCLLHRVALEEVQEPRFLHYFEGGQYSTEDSAFFKKCPYVPFVDHDASKKVWHVGNLTFNWADDYSNLNKIFKEI